MHYYSKIITSAVSLISLVLVNTACKPCHGLMAMPCERSTHIAVVILALILISSILSIIIKKQVLQTAANVINTLLGIFLLLVPKFGQCQVASMSCRLKTFPTLTIGGILIIIVSVISIIAAIPNYRRKFHVHP